MASATNDRLPGIIIPSDSDIHNNAKVTSLMLAAFHGNIERVLTLLKEDQHCIRYRNIFDQTAVHYAIDNGQIKVIDTLLAFEADIDEVDSKGQNILHRCAEYGSMAKVETCLTIGMNIHNTNWKGDTALTIAARSGHLSIVKLLVKSGSDISVRNDEGLNAIDCAFCNNHTQVQTFLSIKKEIPIDHSLKDKMIEECCDGNIESVRELLDTYRKEIVNFRDTCFQCFTPFHVACSNGHLALAQLLKERGANINCRNNIFDTPLMTSSIRNNIQIVKWLITQGVRMNDRNDANENALHVAASTGNTLVVKLLVENGSLLNFHMANGYTAVHFAVQKQQVDILDFLLKQGALPDVTKQYGITPLLQAIPYKSMALVECLISRGASVNKCDHSMNTPLLVALTEKSLDIVRYLIENGADVNIPNKYGIPLQDVARSFGYMDISSYLTNLTESGVHLDERISKNPSSAQDQLFSMCQAGEGTRDQFDKLINAGANVNGIDAHGRTPLIVATQNSSQHCIQLLLEKNARVFARDKQSSTAIEYAVQNESPDNMALLLQNAEHECISDESIEKLLDSAINHSMTVNSNASVCITNMLLKQYAPTRLKGNCFTKLLKKCITFDNVPIAQLLLNYQFRFDVFDPTVVIISCMSSNPDMLQCLVKYIFCSKHRHSYVKLAVRFCLQNQLDQVLCTIPDRLFNTDIFWTKNDSFWSGSDGHAFNRTMEFAVEKALEVDKQNKNGYTFLIFASSKGMVEEVKYLLQKGADKAIATKNGKVALDIALNAGHYETAMLLTDEPLIMPGK